MCATAGVAEFLGRSSVSSFWGFILLHIEAKIRFSSELRAIPRKNLSKVCAILRNIPPAGG
jgi:hypothetical protein